MLGQLDGVYHRSMIRRVILGALFYLVAYSTGATTYTANTLVIGDVQCALNGGAGCTNNAGIVALNGAGSSFVNGPIDGDTVIAPAGTLSLSSSLKITKNITFQGPTSVSLPTTTPTVTITGTGTNGNLIKWTTDSSPATAVLQWVNIQPAGTQNSNGSPAVQFLGTATVRKSGSNLVGGFNVTQCIFSPNTPTTGTNVSIYTSDWVTGKIDHCVWDYRAAPNGGNISAISLSMASAPGKLSGSSFITQAGDTITARWGGYSISNEVPYVPGGGPDLNNVTVGGTLYGTDATYIEDVITEGYNIGFTINDSGGAATGGGRAVVRHCSLSGMVSTHGDGESGNCMSSLFVESYNNYIRPPGGAIPAPTPGFITHNLRSSGAIFFNNLFDRTRVNGPITINNYRMSDPYQDLFGPADGTNFFDNNSTDDPLSVNSTSFAALTPKPSDARVGYRYATGSSSSKQNGIIYILNGFGSPGDPDNKYAGFSLRNETLADAEGTGGQNNHTGIKVQTCDLVVSSTYVTTPSAGTKITLQGGHDTQLTLNSTDTWSFRWVKQVFGAPGMGSIVTLDGNSRVNNGIAAKFGPNAASNASLASNPIWCSPGIVGIWQWANQYRSDGGASFGAFPIGNWTAYKVLGGMKNSTDGTQGDGVLNVDTKGNSITYSTQSSAASKRIGADFDTGNFGAPTNPQSSTNAWGYTYPYPLNVTVVSPPVINSSLTASATVGNSFSYTITATNTPTSFAIDHTLPLPAGFSLDSATGIISSSNVTGQPSVYNVGLQAFNTGGSGTATLVLTIAGTPTSPRTPKSTKRIGTGDRRS
jgi:Putative Ig domain